MITQERLIELFDYSPKWGLFTRRHDDKIMKSINKLGFISIHVDSELYTGHRLAWLYVHGEFPKGHLTHIDGDKTNNSIANLVPSGSPEAIAKKRRERLGKDGAKEYEMKLNAPKPEVVKVEIDIDAETLQRKYEQRLSKFTGAGYVPHGNHLVRQVSDDEFSYILMYERYVKSLLG